MDNGFAAEDGRVAISHLLREHGLTLLQLAAASIRHGLQHARPLPVTVGEYSESLRGDGASFVTLKCAGRLRGCIGSVDAHRPLAEDVAANGYAAAFHDSRFPRLQVTEWSQLQVSVSVLSEPEPMTFASEAELLAQLQPGEDGLIIRSQGRRAVFLPQVWEQLPQPALFVTHLKEKAGLPANHWSPDFRAWRFVTGSVSSDAP